MNTLIYCATFLADGRRYVGQTKTGLAKRKWRHVYDATHPGRRASNTKFARAINKHGADAFTWSPVAFVEPWMLDETEAAVIKLYGSDTDKGYNVDPGGLRGPRGRKLSAEHKARIGRANAGKPRPQELRDRISATKTGKPGAKLSKEGLEKLIAGQHKWRRDNPELVAEKHRKHSEFMRNRAAA